VTLPDLAATLDDLGVRLSVRLVVDAPRGVLSEEIKTALSAHKVLVLQRVVRELVWAELSTCRWGPVAADPTPGIIIDRPDPARRVAAFEAADRHDSYAVAEREAIQAEAEVTWPPRDNPEGPAG
jgi:hypothetical protein